MEFNLFSNTEQAAGFLICVITIPLCILITILRLDSTRRSHRTLGLDDAFAVAALVIYLVFTTIFIYVLTQINGQSYQEIAEASPARLTHILKVGYIMSAQYPANQLFVKLSLLVLYHRLFSVNRTFDIWLYWIGAVQIAWFIPTYIVKYFLCFPVRKIWDQSFPGTCINIGAYLAATEAVNSVIDFVMIGLAIYIVRSLQMSRSTRWKLSIIFSVGSISGIIGFVKIGTAYAAAYENQLSGIWDVIQMTTSIICCSSPIYKSMLPSFGTKGALKSIFGTFSWREYLHSKDHQNTSAPVSNDPSNSGPYNQPQDLEWLRIGNTSENETHWSSLVTSSYGHDQSNKDRPGGHDTAYPLKTLEVKQSVQSRPPRVGEV